MHVSGTSWPKVKSITINGGQNNAQLILPEGTTTLNSNVTSQGLADYFAGTEGKKNDLSNH